MTWVRVDDGFFEHPKTIVAGEDAAYLFLAGLAYCNRQLTDGLIPKGTVRSLTRRYGLRLAQRLVEVGYWHDRGDYYEVHDYLLYQDAKEEIEEKRAKKSRAGRLGGLKSVAVRRAKLLALGSGSASEAESEASASGSAPEAHGEAKSNPIPSPPIPSHPEIRNPPLLTPFGEPPQGGQANGSGTKATKPRTRRIRARLPDEWAPSDDAVAYGKSLGFTDADLERVADEFCTYWWGEGKAKADWDATFENRLLQLKHGGKR